MRDAPKFVLGVVIGPLIIGAGLYLATWAWAMWSPPMC